MFFDQGHGFEAVASLTDQSDLGEAFQKIGQFVPRRFFVIDDDGNLHKRTAEGASIGTSSRRWQASARPHCAVQQGVEDAPQATKSKPARPRVSPPGPLPRKSLFRRATPVARTGWDRSDP